ncbi:putative bifunctional apoptosis regulator [Apostichopus japonicus]|uniref:Putative bifunctional apoptosis regulator n=1 Tax=Stichopus japonicus TaxID=307972 RepID=A0A2G8JUV9_STIJA|nr:putative bifunctional apoptosis regulator [Apostichopus japonicus]
MQQADAQGVMKPASWLREGFFYGVVSTLSIVFIFQSISNWGNSDHDLLVYKPLSTWKDTDVAEWLRELGSWAAPTYSETFLRAGINGYLLMGLENESQLAEDPFLISNALHRKAIYSALERIKDIGGKPPRDVWEYRALHRGLSLFLSYTVREFPRLTISGMYMFYYDDIFLPFIQVTCPQHGQREGHIHTLLYDEVNKVITKEQWMEFIPKFMFLPYYLFAEFAWEYVDVNFVTCSLILANCALLTMIELKALRETWRRGLGPAIWALKKQTNTVLILFFSYIFWSLIPMIVCDLIFYISMYYSVCINFFEVFLQ